jgi:hypothetical protein
MNRLVSWNNKNISLAAGFWIIWTALYAWFEYLSGYSARSSILDSLTGNFLLGAAALLVSNILRHYLPGKNSYLNVIALCAALTLLWFLSSRVIQFNVYDAENPDTVFFDKTAAVRIAVSFLVLVSVSLMTILRENMADKAMQASRKADAEKLAREAELFRLQQQLQPHFLFNSLNSISALVGTDPEQARRMIHQLSVFLRGTLKKDEQQLVSLAEEIKQVELYLEIEKIRFSHRLTTMIHIADDVADWKLPALILQPLLENAIKFGLYQTTGEVEIKLEAAKTSQGLVIRVSNPVHEDLPAGPKGTGFGLASVQRRLYLLYGRNDLLHTFRPEHTFITELTIPHYDQNHTH